MGVFLKLLKKFTRGGGKFAPPGGKFAPPGGGFTPIREKFILAWTVKPSLHVLTFGMGDNSKICIISKCFILDKIHRLRRTVVQKGSK